MIVRPGDESANTVSTLQVLAEDMPVGRMPEKWDGRTAKRIIEVFRDISVVS